VSKSPDGVAVALKTESSSVDDFSKSLSKNFLWTKKGAGSNPALGST